MKTGGAHLNVRGLCKRYPSFMLEDVTFSVEPGQIVGFIGRNGAGKTTTLKCLMGSVHPDAGEIEMFGIPLCEHEAEIKQITGFALGGVAYYETKTVATITSATRRFYKLWDEEAYRGYLESFGIDERKRIKELSQGMRVKYALALAMSHGSKLLILDEPTSGLDPVSRDEVLDVFLDMVSNGHTSILFSTHITSDLDKCADAVIHLRAGRVVGEGPLAEYRDRYRVIPIETARACGFDVLGTRRSSSGTTALVRASNTLGGEPVDLEEIMTYLDKETSYMKSRDKP